MLTPILASFATFLMELESKHEKVDFLDFYYHIKKLWSKDDAIDDALNRVHSNKEHILRDLFYKEFSKIPKERRTAFLRLFLHSMIDYFRKKDKFIGAFLDMNNQCNMNCDNCINKALNHKEDMTWSPEQIKTVLNKIKEYTRFLYVSGGEPYLNPNLSDAIRAYQEMLFLTFTNGTMTDEYKKVIANGSNNVIFIVSIDGTIKEHDIKRGTGSYSKAIDSIKLLRDNGYFTGVSTVVNPGNIDYVLSNSYLEQLKNESDFSFQYYLKEASCNDQEFLKKYIELSGERKKHIDSPVPTFNMPFGEIISKGKTCMAGDSIFHIAVNGDVTSCPFLFKTYGNIFADDMSAISSDLKSSEQSCAYQKKLTNLSCQ